MSEQNKQVVRRYFAEIWSKGNYDVVDELVEAGHSPSGGMALSPEAIKHFVPMFRSAFPDIRYELELLMAEGDKVMAYWKAQGTHKGRFRGVEPTGKTVNYQGFDVYRLVNGKMAERWGLNDDLGLLRSNLVPLRPRH